MHANMHSLLVMLFSPWRTHHGQRRQSHRPHLNLNALSRWSRVACNKQRMFTWCSCSAQIHRYACSEKISKLEHSSLHHRSKACFVAIISGTAVTTLQLSLYGKDRTGYGYNINACLCKYSKQIRPSACSTSVANHCITIQRFVIRSSLHTLQMHSIGPPALLLYGYGHTGYEYITHACLCNNTGFYDDRKADL